jgi:hypothetical protein
VTLAEEEFITLPGGPSINWLGLALAQHSQLKFHPPEGTPKVREAYQNKQAER